MGRRRLPGWCTQDAQLKHAFVIEAGKEAELLGGQLLQGYVTCWTIEDREGAQASARAETNTNVSSTRFAVIASHLALMMM